MSNNNDDILNEKEKTKIIKAGPSPRARVINLRASWTNWWEQLEVQVEHSDECPPTELGFGWCFLKLDVECRTLTFDHARFSLWGSHLLPVSSILQVAFFGKSTCFFEYFTTQQSFQTSSRQEDGGKVSKLWQMPSQSLCPQALSWLSPPKVSQVRSDRYKGVFATRTIRAGE